MFIYVYSRILFISFFVYYNLIFSNKYINKIPRLYSNFIKISLFLKNYINISLFSNFQLIFSHNYNLHIIYSYLFIY